MSQPLADLLDKEEKTIFRLHFAVCNLPASHARALFEAFLLTNVAPRLLIVRTGFIPLILRDYETAKPMNVPPLAGESEEQRAAVIAAAVGAQERVSANSIKLPRAHSSQPHSPTSAAGLMRAESLNYGGEFVTYHHPDAHTDINLTAPNHRVVPVWDEVETMRAVVIAYDAWTAEMQQRLAYDALAGAEGD